MSEQLPQLPQQLAQQLPIQQLPIQQLPIQQLPIQQLPIPIFNNALPPMHIPPMPRVQNLTIENVRKFDVAMTPKMTSLRMDNDYFSSDSDDESKTTVVDEQTIENTNDMNSDNNDVISSHNMVVAAQAKYREEFNSNNKHVSKHLIIDNTDDEMLY
ncbi:ataxin-8 [Biomphalaria glabrata]|nr:ataxin-8 [Biomphalaria glabrata]